MNDPPLATLASRIMVLRGSCRPYDMDFKQRKERTMKIEINIDDYLSEEDKKEICRDIFRREIRKDAERILTNSAHSFVHKAIEEIIELPDKQYLAAEVKRIFEELSSYAVFHEEYRCWPKSKGQIMLDEIIEEKKPILEKRIEKLFLTHEVSDGFVEEIGLKYLDALFEKGLGKENKR